MQLLSAPVPGRDREAVKHGGKGGGLYCQKMLQQVLNKMAACVCAGMKDSEGQKRFSRCTLRGSEGITGQGVRLLPAVFPNLTCRAEKGMSQRNLTGSESP